MNEILLRFDNQMTFLLHNPFKWVKSKHHNLHRIPQENYFYSNLRFLSDFFLEGGGWEKVNNSGPSSEEITYCHVVDTENLTKNIYLSNRIIDSYSRISKWKIMRSKPVLLALRVAEGPGLKKLVLIWWFLFWYL